MQKSDQKLLNSQMSEEVLEGLQKPQKTLPSKYFYDERGSKLFEKICMLDVYYPTDSEIEILQYYMEEIAELIGPNSLIIEFGSGSSRKTRLLLSELKKVVAYVPVDISRDFLLDEASKLEKEFPGLDIQPIAADYTQSFHLNVNGFVSKRVIFFPGSTIGNFRPIQARKFLFRSADLLGERGGLLIGVDLKKDVKVLNKAYNDSKGITAEFNKNILKRLNRELGTKFDLDQFEHHAFYNAQASRIEMHLRSLSNQSIIVDGRAVEFEKGETVRTENSYKYSIKEFKDLISDRYTLVNFWTDSREYFSLFYFEKS